MNLTAVKFIHNIKTLTVFSELWQANLDLAQACLKHPFVQGIADGTLERKKFTYYVGQDAFLLERIMNF